MFSSKQYIEDIKSGKIAKLHFSSEKKICDDFRGEITLALAVLPNGLLARGSSYGSIELRDTHTGIHKKILNGHDYIVRVLTLLPNSLLA